MVYVEGNETLALFFATLPANDEGTVVTYRIVANDSSGFRSESEPTVYSVRPDISPPQFVASYSHLPYNQPPNIPITNWTQVQVRFNITDSGSGVKRAILRYSNSSDLSPRFLTDVEMDRTDGDRYDGSWVGIIPQMASGTNVTYTALAYDFSGILGEWFDNASYTVGTPPHPRAIVFITLEGLDLVSKNITLSLQVGAEFASPYPADRLWCYATRLGESVHTDFTIARNGGFWYQSSFKWTTRLPDTTRLYPFDKYRIGFELELWMPGLNKSNTEIYFLPGLVGLGFDNTVITNQTESDGRTSKVLFEFELTRKPSSIDPIMWAIYALFFMLGSTAWLPVSREHLANRLRIFVGLFTFVVLLLFTVTNILRDLGISEPSVPQVALVSLTCSIVVFAAGSLMFGFLEESGHLSLLLERSHVSYLRRPFLRDNFFNIAMASIALLIVVRLGSSLGFPFGLLEIPQLQLPVVVGLYYAVVARLFMDVSDLGVQLNTLIRRLRARSRTWPRISSWPDES